MRKPKTKTNSKALTQEEIDSRTWVPEKIIGDKIVPMGGGMTQYHVKWIGASKAQASWENEDQLIPQYTNLIREYKEGRGDIRKKPQKHQKKHEDSDEDDSSYIIDHKRTRKSNDEISDDDNSSQSREKFDKRQQKEARRRRKSSTNGRKKRSFQEINEEIETRSKRRKKLEETVFQEPEEDEAVDTSRKSQRKLKKLDGVNTKDAQTFNTSKDEDQVESESDVFELGREEVSLDLNEYADNVGPGSPHSSDTEYGDILQARQQQQRATMKASSSTPSQQQIPPSRQNLRLSNHDINKTSDLNSTAHILSHAPQTAEEDREGQENNDDSDSDDIILVEADIDREKDNNADDDDMSLSDIHDNTNHESRNITKNNHNNHNNTTTPTQNREVVPTDKGKVPDQPSQNTNRLQTVNIHSNNKNSTNIPTTPIKPANKVDNMNSNNITAKTSSIPITPAAKSKSSNMSSTPATTPARPKNTANLSNMNSMKNTANNTAKKPAAPSTPRSKANVKIVDRPPLQPRKIVSITTQGDEIMLKVLWDDNRESSISAHSINSLWVDAFLQYLNIKPSISTSSTSSL